MLSDQLARWAFVITILNVCVFADPEAQAAPPEPLTLDWCLEEANRVNPVIAINQASAEAAEHRVGPAGSLDDPRLEYEAINLPTDHFDFDSTPMSGNQISLSQRFPFPGVLGNRKKAARAGAEASWLELEDRRRRQSGCRPR